MPSRASPERRVAVIGGGWAGISAAVHSSQLGQAVTLFEMAPQLGGRARSLYDTKTASSDLDEAPLDNGQHILIGAYRHCLELLAIVGVDHSEALLRLPLRLRYPRHEGLSLPPGRPLPSFVKGICAYQAWPLAARARLLMTAAGWLLQRFTCAAELTVDQLSADLPAIVKQELIAPLCIAAMNTPSGQASARVFLRVLQDSLFGGSGSSDLLLPRVSLSGLLADPAQTWLQSQGTDLRLGQRLQSLVQQGNQWLADGERFDAVILACTSAEAARLCEDIAPDWAFKARALRYEPIITVYLQSPGSFLPAPMLALQDGGQAPAQFAFDLGQLGHAPGRFAFVVSGAASWVERGLVETGLAALQQAERELTWQSPPKILKVLAEKRATFACTPGLQRPPAQISDGLFAAGDYVAGPYPATLEGAVRSGRTAAITVATRN
jgi:squalene-associated FAD-dependent desaturase